MGWSTYSMFAYSLKLYGLSDGVLAPFTKWQGPFSWKRPIMLEHPGPPLNHAASGAVVGLLRASKNLTMFSIARVQRVTRVVPEPHVHVCPHGQIARVLVHS